MSIGSYLEALPLSEIAKYTEGPPKDSVPFTGYSRQHPSDKGKLILICDPLGDNPVILEFKIEDVVHVDEMHSAVNQAGEGVPLIKLWVRKGAHGVIMEPFQVDDALRFSDQRGELRERFRKIGLQAAGAEGT
jgi:inorganic pyrophosphatase